MGDAKVPPVNALALDFLGGLDRAEFARQCGIEPDAKQCEILRSTGRNINVEKNVLKSQEVDEDGQETDARHGFQRCFRAASTALPGYRRGALSSFRRAAQLPARSCLYLVAQLLHTFHRAARLPLCSCLHCPASGAARL